MLNYYIEVYLSCKFYYCSEIRKLVDILHRYSRLSSLIDNVPNKNTITQ
jgi:hypothetical protein